MENIFITDICLYGNKLYILDSQNPFIYCYDLDLISIEKIKIPSNAMIRTHKTYFCVSKKFIYIVDQKTFLIFDPKTQYFVEPKKFLNLKAFGINTISDESIAIRSKQYCFLFILKPSENESKLIINSKNFSRITFDIAKLVSSGTAHEQFKSPNGRLNIICLNNDEAKIIKFDSSL